MSKLNELLSKGFIATGAQLRAFGFGASHYTQVRQVAEPASRGRLSG